MRPEIYTAKWLTTEALTSRILVGEETWKDWFRRAKLKHEFGRPEVGKSPF